MVCQLVNWCSQSPERQCESRWHWIFMHNHSREFTRSRTECLLYAICTKAELTNIFSLDWGRQNENRNPNASEHFPSSCAQSVNKERSFGRLTYIRCALSRNFIRFSLLSTRTWKHCFANKRVPQIKPVAWSFISFCISVCYDSSIQTERYRPDSLTWIIYTFEICSKSWIKYLQRK